ncbi:MAG: hypothetical protein VKJ46_14615 [Leptolyngbyaceae bacterium]|nr:hypothetical protein [Leptolyngbyaceae bacterium]
MFGTLNLRDLQQQSIDHKAIETHRLETLLRSINYPFLKIGSASNEHQPPDQSNTNYLKQLIDQPLLQLRFSYGDELTLHFGNPQQYSSPKLQHLVKGSYIIGARASPWLLFNPDGIFLGYDEEKSEFQSISRRVNKQEIKTNVNLIQSGTLIDAADLFTIQDLENAWGFGLWLHLANGSLLLIIPNSGKEKILQDEEVADWEIFMPNNLYLRVGPGLKGSYLANNCEIFSFSNQL